MKNKESKKKVAKKPKEEVSKKKTKTPKTTKSTKTKKQPKSPKKKDKAAVKAPSDEKTELLVDDVIDLTVVVDESKTTDVKEQKVNLKLYFNEETHRSIVEFQSLTDRKVRDKLYVEKIMPAFEKLVENLINIYKFTSIHDTYEELKVDCVNFLFETIHKFDETRGTNAFSYFNVVAKNWLIIKTKQKVQKMKKLVSLDDPESLTSYETCLIEEYNYLPFKDADAEFANRNEIVTMLYDIRTKVKSENELSCINSIITIFENLDDIDLLNKSAVLLYMRELSGLTPKQMTTTMQAIKSYYKKLKVESAKSQ